MMGLFWTAERVGACALRHCGFNYRLGDFPRALFEAIAKAKAADATAN